MKKILLVASYYFENLGDPLYMITAKRLIEEYCDSTVDIADIYGYTSMPGSTVAAPSAKKDPSLKRIIKKGYRFAKRLVRKVFFHDEKKEPFQSFLSMYRKMVQGYDVVIIPGGGYIYFNEYDFHIRIEALEKACKESNIAFCMNAVGISIIYNKPYINIPSWQRIIDNKDLRYITCRDGAEKLSKYIKRPLKLVGCTATLAGDLFGIKKDTESNVIGVGVIRGNAFSSNGFEFDEEMMIDFYANLINKLTNEGHRVKVFINGLSSDYAIAVKIMEKTKDNAMLLDRATTPEELVSQIASFRAVMCARLHAAITAFSLDIPTVLFCWGEKGQEFMRFAGMDEFALTPDKMTADYAMEKLQKCMQTGWNQEKRREIQNSARQSIVDLLKTVDAMN